MDENSTRAGVSVETTSDYFAVDAEFIAMTGIRDGDHDLYSASNARLAHKRGELLRVNC
jgi:hypothetical protein